MIRRTVEAIVVAHSMDRSRRSLFVEGLRDRLFLSWLLGKNLDKKAVIVEIDFVSLPDNPPGGNRGRLIQFASLLGTRHIQIRMFADADWDRLLGRAIPDRVWLTDHRDMEGYVLCEMCLDKVLRLGVACERISARAFLSAVFEQGRRLGALRLTSDLEGLNLPFQRTDLGRHVEVDGDAVSVNLDNYLRALLQNAGLSLASMDAVKARVQQVQQQFAAIADREIVHGKDAVAVLEVFLRRLGIAPGESERLLWTSFESGLVEQESALAKVTAFLTTA